MKGMAHSVFCLACLGGWLHGEDLFSIPGEEPKPEKVVSVEEPSTDKGPEIQESSPWSFKGTFDLRLVSTGKEASWTENGEGRTLYGGKASTGGGSRRDLSLKWTRFALEGGWKDGPFQLHFQVNADDGPSDGGDFGLVESWVSFRHQFDDTNRMKIRMGLLFPPVSLEHPDEAWSTRYTLTPSAINSWVGEEVRPLAFEWNLTRDWKGLYPITWTGAIFSNNDPAGSILAWRGWSLHDHQWRTGGTLPLSNIPAILVPNSNEVQPFKEIDGRPGVYTGLSMLSPRSWKIRYLYSHSLAPENVLDSIREYTWTTSYHHLGLEWQPEFNQNLIFLSQWMDGKTWMGPAANPGVRAGFSAMYLMASYDLHEKGRLSVRYDQFEVEDQDSMAADANESEGWALTLAYLRPWREKHLFGLEGVVVRSDRPGNTGVTDDPDDDLFSLFYRFTF